jgi:dolichol kinase
MDFADPKLVGGLLEDVCDTDLPTISGNILSYGDGVASTVGISLSVQE